MRQHYEEIVSKVCSGCVDVGEQPTRLEWCHPVEGWAAEVGRETLAPRRGLCALHLPIS